MVFCFSKCILFISHFSIFTNIANHRSWFRHYCDEILTLTWSTHFLQAITPVVRMNGLKVDIWGGTLWKPIPQGVELEWLYWQAVQKRRSTVNVDLWMGHFKRDITLVDYVSNRIMFLCDWLSSHCSLVTPCALRDLGYIGSGNGLGLNWDYAIASLHAKLLQTGPQQTNIYGILIKLQICFFSSYRNGNQKMQATGTGLIA